MIIKVTDRYDSLLQYYSFIVGLDWQLLKAQIAIESSFNPRAINSKSKCKGLGQFAYATFKEWGRYSDPFNPEEAIRAQAYYMAYLQRMVQRWGVTEDILQKALACYNWGMGNMRKHLVKYKNNQNWIDNLPEETREYIQKIMEQYQKYQEDAEQLS